MERILFLSTVESDGTLAKPALEAFAQADELTRSLPEAELLVGLVGSKAEEAAKAVGGGAAKKFLAVDGADFDQSRYATDADAFEALAKAAAPSLIIAGGTPRIARTLPGLAARLNGFVDTHVTGIAAAAEGVQVKRWFYRQRMEGALSRTGRPWILITDPGSFPAWSSAPQSPAVEKIAAGAVQTRTQVVGVESPAGDEQTIRPEAELLMVAGAGWTKKQPDGQPHLAEARELILGFLAKTKASLGSSKSLVDMEMDESSRKAFSFMSHMNQIGQTGATPRHAKGLSTCCHGEEPHVVGWRFINERRAVNLDPNCGWARGKADVLYVADAFKVIAKLNELL